MEAVQVGQCGIDIVGMQGAKRDLDRHVDDATWNRRYWRHYPYPPYRKIS